MTRTEIARIIHTYFIRLKKHFRSIEKNMTETSVKPFRIEIKKLRAFLRLLELEAKDPDDLKLPGSMKEMHKSGGMFRDLLLQQERVKKAAKKKPSVTYNLDRLLKENTQQVKKERKHFLSNKDLSREEKKIKKHLPDKYDKNTVKQFFSEKKESILDIVARARFNDKELHSIRKKLKDILYIIKLYANDIKARLGFRSWSKAELLKVKSLEDQLGFLNDSRNALLLLDTTDINRFEGEDKKLLLSVRRHLLAEKRELKKQVLLSLKKIFPLHSSNNQIIKV